MENKESGNREDISRIKEILKRALSGPWNLNEFYKKCDADWKKNPLFDAILNNAEDFMEHQRSDFEANKGCEAFRIMKYDLALLEKLNEEYSNYLFAKRPGDIRHL